MASAFKNTGQHVVYQAFKSLYLEFSLKAHGTEYDCTKTGAGLELNLTLDSVDKLPYTVISNVKVQKFNHLGINFIKSKPHGLIEPQNGLGWKVILGVNGHFVQLPLDLSLAQVVQILAHITWP